MKDNELTWDFTQASASNIQLLPLVGKLVGFMMLNATFKNISAISWRSVLLVEETEYQEKTTDLPHCTDKLYHVLLNDKEFCFSLIGLNSIFSPLPQSEYTSRAVSTPRVRYIRASIVYSVFQRCPTRDKISFPVGQSNCKKKVKIFKNFKILQNLIFFKKFSYKISKFYPKN